jgi:hypothetical protein
MPFQIVGHVLDRVAVTKPPFLISSRAEEFVITVPPYTIASKVRA